MLLFELVGRQPSPPSNSTLPDKPGPFHIMLLHPSNNHDGLLLPAANCDTDWEEQIFQSCLFPRPLLWPGSNKVHGQYSCPWFWMDQIWRRCITWPKVIKLHIIEIDFCQVLHGLHILDSSDTLQWPRILLLLLAISHTIRVITIWKNTRYR